MRKHEERFIPKYLHQNNSGSRCIYKSGVPKHEIGEGSIVLLTRPLLDSVFVETVIWRWCVSGCDGDRSSHRFEASLH